MSQQYSLRWNNHQPNFISMFTTLLNTQTLVDVTLAADGKQLLAHKVVLSACSTYFQSLFVDNPSPHPIVILKDVTYADLRTMVDFMYCGEVNVTEEQLPKVLDTAKLLKIKGLTEMPDSTSLTRAQGTSSEFQGDSMDSQRHSPAASPSNKRKRRRKSSTGSTSLNMVGEENRSEMGAQTVEAITLSSVPQQRRMREYHEVRTIDNAQQVLSGHGCFGRYLHKIAGREATPGCHECGGAEDTAQHTLEACPAWAAERSQLCAAIGADLSLPAVIQSMTSEADNLNVDQIALDATPTGLPQVAEDPSIEAVNRFRRTKNLRRQSRVPDDREVRKQVSEPALATAPAPKATPALQKHESYPQYATPKPSLAQRLKMEHEVGSLLIRPVTSMDRQSSTTTTSTSASFESTAASDSPPTHRASHTPAVRSGPPLSCNFCWNTVDECGRILRRKTQYHCPECRTNLCIVPCFHEYHEGPVSDATANAR